MDEMDIVVGGIVPDELCMVGAEVVQYEDQAFVRICLYIRFQDLPDIFLFGPLPEGDEGVTVHRKNAKRIGSNLCRIFHQWWALKRPHPLRIGSIMRRMFIKEYENCLVAHPRKFLKCLRIGRSAIIPSIWFPKPHPKRLHDSPDLIRTVGDAKVSLNQVLHFPGRPVLFFP